jgi:hypothetical protein
MTKTVSSPKPTPARAASSLPKVHLVQVSGNAKTGPIPVSTTEKSSCPGTCPFLSQCYADFGPLALHWNRIPERGMEWADFARKIAALPRGQLWRHNQAGDLPASPAGRLRAETLRALVRANKGRRGFTYTHHTLTTQNVALLREANAGGFTVNVSCETVAQVDRARALSLPAVLVAPAVGKGYSTAGGHPLRNCPATQFEHINCANCGICAKSDRETVIVFPPHGAGTKRVLRILEAIRVSEAAAS